MNISYDAILDARQDECPVPTIKAKEALDALPNGGVLKLVASTEGTIRNIRTFVSSNGYELLGESRSDEGLLFFIRKA